MGLINADALPRRKITIKNEWHMHEEVEVVYADDIDNAPTVIHLCEVCKHRHNTWDSETCDGCTGRECNFNPIDPVRHGKWIVKWWDDDGDARDWACSVCGFSHVYFYDMPNNYCPNCGAKMDGGEE